MDNTYNGWSNWETWNLNLWLDEYQILRKFQEDYNYEKPLNSINSPCFRTLENYIVDFFELCNNGKIEDRFYIDNHHINFDEIIRHLYDCESWED